MKSLLKKLSLKRKIILSLVSVYAIAALLNGNWVITIALVYFIYWYANKPVYKKPISQPVPLINPDDYSVVEADDNSTPNGFNQLSSSGNNVWTDYDEHINKQ